MSKQSGETGVKDVQRVLVYRLGSLGDMVVALPCLHLIARTFPGAERRLLTNFPVDAKAPAAEAVLGSAGGRGGGLIHGYMRYTAGSRNAFELIRLWWQIVRWRPEVVVYLAAARGVETARRDARFFRACGVRRLVGVPLTPALQQNFYGHATGQGFATNRPGAIVLGADWEPEAERLARCIAPLGDARAGDRGSWDLQLTEAERAAAQQAIGLQASGLQASGLQASAQQASGLQASAQQASGLQASAQQAMDGGPIAVSVGTKVQAKDWGAANWEHLLGRMALDAPGRTLVLLGAAVEGAASEAATAGWRRNGGGPVVNLCGRLTPRESAAALETMTFFVGHDSGPMHLAAAVGTPCVAIFAARNMPRVWFPPGDRHRVLYHAVDCAGCGLEVCIERQKRCLTSISVDEVLDAVRAIAAPPTPSNAVPGDLA